MDFRYSCLELCAGAGGQALGLHQAGFTHSALIEIDEHACSTLRYNNSVNDLGWGPVFECDLKDFAAHEAEAFFDVDLVAGGVPCPPFSKAGKQLGRRDERDLFPVAVDIVETTRPRGVMLENVSGLLDAKFDSYRAEIEGKLRELGYQSEWKLLNASDFGVPQLRPRVILVALRPKLFDLFSWPIRVEDPPSVGEALYDLMAQNGWEGAKVWKERANKIAPTLVGGSKKHGGPDLGPSRARAAWKQLCVNGSIIGNEAPAKDFKGYKDKEEYKNMPLLTLRMAARIQGFPDWWEFSGRKTHAYRQIGNAFPPPVAKSVGQEIYSALAEFDSSETKVA